MAGGPAPAQPGGRAEGRVLAVDWGRKRFGVALSDPGRLIAQPLTTLARREGQRPPIAALLDLIRTHAVTALVVGLPLSLAGEEGEAAAEVRVFGDADLSGVYRVSSDGMINFPLVGKVKADGLSSTGLADLLTARLKDGFLKDPQVSVFVKEYNSKKVFVFGEVQKPGTFPYEDDMTIIQAITIAGGFTKTAAKNKVAVTRLEDGTEKRVFLSVEEIGRGKEKNFFMKPGDIVFVPESLF